MLVTLGANASKLRSLGELDTLSGKKTVLNEFSYRQNAEIFGKGEPAEYLFQVVEGAIRSYKLLSHLRCSLPFFTHSGYLKTGAPDTLFRVSGAVDLG
jgi:CRP/FNR family nitrogen fixation transcriptional regulator